MCDLRKEARDNRLFYAFDLFLSEFKYKGIDIQGFIALLKVFSQLIPNVITGLKCS